MVQTGVYQPYPILLTKIILVRLLTYPNLQLVLNVSETFELKNREQALENDGTLLSLSPSLPTIVLVTYTLFYFIEIKSLLTSNYLVSSIYTYN